MFLDKFREKCNDFYEGICKKYFMVFCLCMFVILPCIMWISVQNTAIKDIFIKLASIIKGEALNVQHWHEKLPNLFRKFFCLGVISFVIIAGLRFCYLHYKEKCIAVYKKCIALKWCFFIVYILFMLKVMIRHRMYIYDGGYLAWYTLLLPLVKMGVHQAYLCIISFLITLLAAFVFARKAKVSNLIKIIVLVTSSALFFNATCSKFYILLLCIFFALKALLSKPYDKRILGVSIFILLANCYKIFINGGIIDIYFPYMNGIYSIIAPLVLYFSIIKYDLLQIKGLWFWQEMAKWNIYTALSLAYIFVPILIFVCAWLHVYYAVPVALIMCVCYYQMNKDFATKEDVTYKIGGSKTYWIVVSSMVFIWVLFSGIGGFGYQDWDYWARFPIYNDIAHCKWPIFYNLAEQSEYVKALVGDSVVAFTYYFAFWLPPALLYKIFSCFCRDISANLFLLLWAYAGVMLVIYQIHRFIKRTSLLIPFVLIFFSGLWILGQIILFGLKAPAPANNIIIWASKYFTICSNTTNFWYSFNQTLPAWLITILFLRARKSSSSGLCSLTFAYSPFVTIGILPLALVSVFNKKEAFKKNFTLQNIFLPIAMLVIFGTFYKSNPQNVASPPRVQLYFTFDFAKYYILLVLLTYLAYIIVMYKKIKCYDYLFTSTLVFLILPLIIYADHNFMARGSMPVLFILCVYVIKFMLEEKSKITRSVMKGLLIVSVASVIPTFSLNLFFSSLKQDSNFIIYSFEHIASQRDENIIIAKNQFFTYEPEKTFFFKYLGKSRVEDR